MYATQYFVPQDFIISQGAPTQATVNGSLYSGWSLAAAGANAIATTFPAPYQWNNGNLIAVNVYWAGTTTNTGTVTFHTWIQDAAVNAAIATGALQTTTITSTAYTTGNLNVSTIALSPQIAHTVTTLPTNNNLIAMSVGRAASDSYTGAVIIIGVELVFQSVGPQSTNHGTYGFNGMGH